MEVRMSNYIGVKCPVCGKKFTQADDIVVCPVCGAPHHRECYAKENACAFTSDHLSGKEWRAPPPDPVHTVNEGGEAPYSWNNNYAGTDGFTVCAVCKAKNPKDSIFCKNCGSRMGSDPDGFWGGQFFNMDPVSMIYGGVNPNEKIGDETARDLAVYIGSGSAYYLPRFKVLEESERTFMFNFSALVFGFFYFFYRKMYLAGFILLAVFLLGFIPNILWMMTNPQMLTDLLPPSMQYYFSFPPASPGELEKTGFYQQLSNIVGTLDLLIRIAVSFFATRLYFIKATGDIKQIRENQTDRHDEIAYCEELRIMGGTSKVLIIILLSAYVALSFIIASYISYKYLQVGGAPPL